MTNVSSGRCMKLTRLAGALTGLGLALSFSPPAAAERIFPAAVSETVGLSCTPSCLLCHTRPEGGIANLGPVGHQLLDNLRVHNRDSLISSLRCLHERNCPDVADSVYDLDSDGDGVSNIEEIYQGRSPTEPGATGLCGPTYGCGARVEPRGSLDPKGIAAITLAAACLWAFQRRVRRRQREES
jgi:hypothetical protein